jgi:DNA-binding NarL/FixJ family response regulator
MKDISQLVRYSYKEIPYQDLMRKRIHKVLLLCSPYDAFLFEEDGRIDEKLFYEYTSLNLSRPPEIVLKTNIEEAHRLNDEDRFDLVIVMFEMGDKNPIDISLSFREKNPDLPIVILTPLSREASLIIKDNKVEAIDYVFSWLGDEEVLMAIIKLIEDKMNAEHDMLDIGVQAILLVEDSVRFYSTYLPNLYKMIFKQSVSFMTEGLNEHQRMMRMRGRPKVLLVNNYEDAIEVYNIYKDNILGVISDITFPKNGELNPEAGLILCKHIKQDNPYVPVLIQSSQSEKKAEAELLKAGFIDKNSKSLTIELEDFVNRYFAFGDFVFYDPKLKKEVFRANNLKTLQKAVMIISDDCLRYHISGNNFSKWLNARAIFSIAAIFKQLSEDDFEDLSEVRKFIYDAIAYYRHNKSKGIIAGFYKDRFDEYFNFARIGQGSIGGKGRGLAFLDSMIKRNNLVEKWEHTILSIPPTVVIGVDVFSEFMKNNHLYEFVANCEDDALILQRFTDSKLPEEIKEDLKAFVNVITKPVAVRSSSVLEDSHYQPFAGVYSTYMIPCCLEKEDMFRNLLLAIKSVYASVFFRHSRQYMLSTKNLIDEEKMGIVLQEVVGNKHGDYFYPILSGVARSLNFYPLIHEKPEDGIVNLAFGLGKAVVDGGQTLRFSPKYPEKILQLSSPAMAMKETQKQFYALSMDKEAFKASIDDGVNIIKRSIDEAINDSTLDWITSTFDYENNMIVDGNYVKGKKVVTFANILKYNKFPLADMISEILKLGSFEMNKPIEIEFAVELSYNKSEPHRFYLLQIRPIVDNHQVIKEDLKNIPHEDLCILSNHAIGNGVYDNIYNVVYVKPATFNPANNQMLVEVIDKLNKKMSQEGKNYILIGPGRWGSSDPWLGIPVKWSNISESRLIIESSTANYMIDPSQGTHFFQNLTSFGVGYFTINEHHQSGFVDYQFLDMGEIEFEDTDVKLLRFEKPLIIKIDAKQGLGLVEKNK